MNHRDQTAAQIPLSSSAWSKAARQRGQWKASLMQRFGNAIHKLEQSGATRAVVAELENIRRGLAEIGRQEDAERASSLGPSQSLVPTSGNFGGSHAEIQSARRRASGAMLGLAIGEALGLTTDGWPRDSYNHFSDMHGGGYLDVKRGHWAADTATTLMLLESLQSRGHLDEHDFMERLSQWQQEGAYSSTGDCRGIGPTTKAAIERYRQTGNPIAGDPNPNDLSNASLVRVAPVAIRYWTDPIQLIDVAARQSRTTHAAPTTVGACVVFAQLLAHAISGAPRDVVLAGHSLAPGGPAGINPASWKRKRRPEIRSNDNVLNSLEAALWCIGTTNSFEAAVLLAMNLGEDSGTVAALAGQLAGAIRGISGIPAEWIERLAWRDRILAAADALFEQSLPGLCTHGYQ